MSTNCIRCMVNRRTGLDLLCDTCRPPIKPAEDWRSDKLLRLIKAALAAIGVECDPARMDGEESDDPGAIDLPGTGLSVSTIDSYMPGDLTGAAGSARVWAIWRAVVIRGVRYRQDGSGEPDDMDIEEVGKIAHLAGIPHAIAMRVAQDRIEVFLQAESEAQEVAELEQSAADFPPPPELGGEG